MFDIVAGYPLYCHYIALISQFAMFPILATFCSVGVFNAYLLTYLVKDFAYETTLVDNVLIAHHIIGIWATVCFSRSNSETWIITVAEIGSGSYNLYTLAKAYENNVDAVYAFYAVVMSLSNIYCTISVLRHKTRWYYKVPVLALIIGRQVFMHQAKGTLD